MVVSSGQCGAPGRLVASAARRRLLARLPPTLRRVPRSVAAGAAQRLVQQEAVIAAA
jgi:hypothetical protein